MSKINIQQLKQMIHEEIKRLHETDEYKDGSKVMKSAADLISAIKTFQETASESAKTHIGVDTLDELVKKLDSIARNSMNFIDASAKPNPTVKKAVFKPTIKND